MRVCVYAVTPCRLVCVCMLVCADGLCTYCANVYTCTRARVLCIRVCVYASMRVCVYARLVHQTRTCECVYACMVQCRMWCTSMRVCVYACTPVLRVGLAWLRVYVRVRAWIVYVLCERVIVYACTRTKHTCIRVRVYSSMRACACVYARVVHRVWYTSAHM